MTRYIITRLLKSIVSIFLVVSIVIVMLFTLIPRMNVVQNDGAFNKLQGDARTTYLYTKLDELGYLHFIRQAQMCEVAEDVAKCNNNDPAQLEYVTTYWQDNGYEVSTLLNGTLYGIHDYKAWEILFNYYKKMIVIDSPSFVEKNYGVKLENTGYRIGTDFNGLPALIGNGTKYKYQLYLDGSFPFIHQNIIHLNFGKSYPTKAGMDTLAVINTGQGEQKQVEMTFETGNTMKSAANLHTLRYKTQPDSLDQRKFNDNYAEYDSYYQAPSMVSMSYLMGIIALLITYAIAIPAGIFMARKKDKLPDKIGLVYINILNSVPSLAFIFFMRQIGMMLGLPASFPQLGYFNVKSYIMPIVILGLMSTPSLMTWTRRYMLDQANSDYVKFARAKGLSEGEVYKKHILKNAIIPVVNGIPGSIILCISGAFITESAFSVPGMGKMLPDSIKALNSNMVITLVFLFTTLSVLSVLAGDVLMTVIDPRIQLASKGGTKKR
ncbi:MAG: ABC transporter permease [Erysipelotrichaceae bacterium]|nr:ABC transporter permease [Erysipelotrichaceae bacterium]